MRKGDEMNQNQIKKDISGRSLVELIGTLAIMGILTIGGISGYRYAIHKYHVVSTIDELSKRSVIHIQQMSLSGSVNQSEFGDKTALDLPVFVEVNDEGGFDLSLDAVEERLCRSLIQARWKIPYQTFVNGNVAMARPELCQAADNTITFSFKITSSGCGSDTDCPCGSCVDGMCTTNCNGKEICLSDFDSGQKTCCPEEKRVGDSCCAHKGTNGNCCDSKGNNCCPPDKPLMDKAGVCHACDENTIILIDQLSQNCNRCSNRIYRNAGYGYIGWCVPKSCPSDKPVMDYHGVCYGCDETVSLRDTTGGAGSSATCAACPTNGVFDDKYCMKCPGNMIRINGICTCPAGSVMGYTNGTNGNPTCYSCDTDNLKAVAYWRRNPNKPCATCPNRMVVSPNVYYYDYCALKICPEGYIHNRYGSCISCATDKIEIKPSTLSVSCSECNIPHYTDGNYCRKCPASGTTAWESLTPEQQSECQ